MKKIIIVTTIIFSSTIIKAQKSEDDSALRPSNNVYVNVLGDASWISVNYERRFFVRPTYFLTGKIGYGYNEGFDLCIWGGAILMKYIQRFHIIFPLMLAMEEVSLR